MNNGCSVMHSRDFETESDTETNRAEFWLVSVWFLCRALCESVQPNNAASYKKSCLDSDSMHPHQP